MAAVFAARDLADYGEEYESPEALLRIWDSPGFDLASDAQLVQDGGQVVAVASVDPRGAVAAVVPGAEGRGIGTALLRFTQARERELGRVHYRQVVAASNDRAKGLLEADGYTLQRSYLRMSRPCASIDPAAAIPTVDGYAFRPLHPADDATEVHALDARAFAGRGDYFEQPLDEFIAEHLSWQEFSGLASVVAIAPAGELAGFAIGFRPLRRATVHIEVLAVDPAHQGHGLGRQLLLGAFSAAAAGHPEIDAVELAVASDNPRAVALYESVGMRPRLQSDNYERPVSRGSLR